MRGAFLLFFNSKCRRYFCAMKRLVLFLIILISLSRQVNAQNPGRIFDTVYYDNNFNIVIFKSNSSYFRVPATKDTNNKYTTTYYRKNGSLYKKGSYKAVLAEYKLSIEDGVGIQDGVFTFYNEEGEKQEEGHIVNDERAGVWNVYFKGDFVFTKTYSIRGVDPHYTFFYAEDRRKSEGVLHYGKIVNGVEAYTTSTSDRTTTTSMRTTVASYRSKYVREGTWKFYDSASGNLQKMCNYIGGVLDGMCVYYHSDTKKKAKFGYYMLGKKIGVWLTFDKQGELIKIENYEAGYRHGDYKEYNPANNKTIAFGTYYNGNKTGVWKTFDRDSTMILSEGEFIKGSGTIKYYDSGSRKLLAEKSFKNDRGHGMWKYYYVRDGKMRLVQEYGDGMLSGDTKRYDTAGYLIQSIAYEGGKEVGGKFYYAYSDKLMSEHNIHEEDTSGELKSYYRDGQKKRLVKLNGGKPLMHQCYTVGGELMPCDDLHKKATCSENIQTYIGKNLRYPPDAITERIEGKIEVGFIVNEDGKVSNIELLNHLTPEMDNEAMRLIKEMPQWTPEILEERSFASYHKVPIVFWLPDEEFSERNVTAK